MAWIIDAHCHLEDPDYDQVRTEILASMDQDRVLCLVNPGSDQASSRRALDLARQEKRVYACVGSHPHEARFYTEETEAQYRSWAKEEAKVVAIGEIGLDYHYDLSPRKTQQEVLERQLQLAKDLDLPVVIHSREAASDTQAILKNFGSTIRALLHSYSEEVADWKALEAFGYYISLGGMVTFKNAPRPKALAQAVPVDRLLLETDGPYLAPVPFRGQLNRPAYAWKSLEAMAALRGVEREELAEQVLENTIRFYGFSEADQASWRALEGKERKSQ